MAERPNTFIKSRKTPRSQEDYIQSLDPLLKRNRGSSTLYGYDTLNNGFRLPEGTNVANPYGLEGFDTNIDYQSQVPQGINIEQMQSGSTNGGISASDFNRKVREAFSPKPVQQRQDGTVVYEDGSVGYAPMEYLDVVWDFGDGTVLYSDGTVRYKEQDNIDNLDSFQNAMFGQNYPITQEYGNYNPTLEPNPRGINTGTDIGVSYQQLNSPFNGTVVQILKDDGTRFGDKSGHKGYGNSVLMQLPDGNYIRYSHLSQIAVNEGDIITPNTPVGITGATGNVTGPHLDLELYDRNGRVISPDDFIASLDPNVVGTPSIDYGIINNDQLSDEKKMFSDTYKRTGRLASEDSQRPQNNQEAVQYRSPAGQEPAILGMSAVKNSKIMTPEQAGITPTQKFLGEMESFGSAISAPEMYVGEGSRPRSQENPYGYVEGKSTPVRQAAGNFIDTALTSLNAPELGVSERLAGVSTPNTGRIKQLPDYGLTELSKGDIPQSISKFATSPLGVDFGKRAFEFISNLPVGKVYASDGNQEVDTSAPIAQKTNQSLIADRILTELNNLKGQLFGSSIYSPTPAPEMSVVGNTAPLGNQSLLPSNGGKATLNMSSASTPDTFVKQSVQPSQTKSGSTSSNKQSSSKSSSSNNLKSSGQTKQSSTPAKATTTTTFSKYTPTPKQVAQDVKSVVSSPVTKVAVNYATSAAKNAVKNKINEKISPFKNVISAIKSIFGIK